MCACGWVWSYMWRPEVDPGYLSLAILHIILRPGLSLNLKFIDLAMLVGQLVQRPVSLVCITQCWSCRNPLSCPVLFGCWGSKLKSMLISQALWPLSHLSSPTLTPFINSILQTCIFSFHSPSYLLMHVIFSFIVCFTLVSYFITFLEYMYPEIGRIYVNI